MALAEKTLSQTLIASIDPASPTVCYTGTAGDEVNVILVTNIHTADVTVTLWMAPSGTTNSNTYKKFFNATTIPVNDFVQIRTFFPMQTTGMHWDMICSVTNGVTLVLTGASVT